MIQAMMRISERLAALAALVTQGNILADIGCDHGYLPIYLVQQRRIPRAIAMDVRPGPLSRARENIGAYGLLDYIEVRESDGLEALAAGEAQTVVIAGMGGPLMEGILRRGAQKISSVRELILQPQSDVEHFRRFLQEIPFIVTDEEMVKEDGKFYPMMRLRPQGPGDDREVWTDAQCRYGRHLLSGRHPILGEYLRREKEKLDGLEERLRSAEGSHAAGRLAEVLREKECIQEVLEEYGFDV